MKPDVAILPPGPLQVERLFDGRRRLLRPLNLDIRGRKIKIPQGFTTDYSSWPPLPGPRWSKIDLAGVVHDALYQWGTWGPDGEDVSKWLADRVWYIVARAGSHPKARASWLGAAIGFAGLTAFGWIVWWRYRWSEDS